MLSGTILLFLFVNVSIIVYLLNFTTLPLHQLCCSIREVIDNTRDAGPTSKVSSITTTHSVESPLEICVHLSVKTTESLHDDRLSLLARTWFQTVPKDNLYVVTDVWNSSTSFEGFKLYSTTCPKGHGRNALSCKSGVEYDLYYSAVDKGVTYKWFCHFDDDIYVNAVALQKLLSSYNNSGYWYLGRWPSTHYGKSRRPIPKQALVHFPNLKRKEHYYATGAAYCLSGTLMRKMEVYLRGPKKFQSLSQLLKLPDDFVVGFVVESLLGYELTVVPTMHSHVEKRLKSIPSQELPHQVTISYGSLAHGKPQNIISLPYFLIPIYKDKTRFLSYHCLLYPHISWCANFYYLPENILEGEFLKKGSRYRV